MVNGIIGALMLLAVAIGLYIYADKLSHSSDDE